jgi:hypothetical protein
MPVYLVPFEEMQRVTRSLGDRQKRAFYWEGRDGFVVEYPITNQDGAATGVVYRTEFPYEGAALAILERNPAATDVEIANTVVLFEKVFLSEWFRKVDGEVR